MKNNTTTSALSASLTFQVEYINLISDGKQSWDDIMVANQSIPEEIKGVNLTDDICKEIENLIRTAGLSAEEKIKLWIDVSEFISKWIETNIGHHEGG
jgi:hypothetical protein